jgi:hypothetical protein
MLVKPHIKRFWIAGIVAAGVFLFLILLRLDVMERMFSGPKSLVFQGRGISARESWMGIFQNNRKIGFYHKRIIPKNRSYELEENILMRIKTMGLVQEINLHTRADLLPDMSLERFEFKITSGRFRFSAQGTVSDKVLTVHTETAGASRKIDVPLQKRPYLTATIIDTLSMEHLKSGDRYRFDIFDPALMAQTAVQAEVIGQEEIPVMGTRIPATRISMSFRGLAQTAWIGENGEVLRERGVLGMRLEKATRQEAMKELGAASQDLTEVASVSPNREIADPQTIDVLRVRFGGAALEGLQLKGGRQRFVNGILSVHREDLTDLPEMPREQEMAALERVFLRPEALIQSDHERIRSLVRSILGESHRMTPLAKARLLMEWAYRHIEKRPVLSLPDALSTLENRMGDCNEHAVLLAAMARAAGIPARVEAGLVYMRGKFYYHAWNLLFIGRWVTADALFGQLPADATHLRLVTGSMKQQVDLMGVIGNISIEILD